MSRWNREQDDHVYENTVSRPGPIVRSRVVDSEVGPQGLTGDVVDTGLVRCPTCGELFPDIAAACPDDGTTLTAESQGAQSGE